MRRPPLPVIDHPLVDSIHLYLKTNPHMETTGAGVLLRSAAKALDQAAKIMRNAVQLVEEQKKENAQLRREFVDLKQSLTPPS
jgi:hypothetical protein